jgi:hypothetical protein
MIIIETRINVIGRIVLLRRIDNRIDIYRWRGILVDPFQNRFVISLTDLFRWTDELSLPLVDALQITFHIEDKPL